MNQSLYEQLVMQTQMNYSRYYGVYAQGETPIKLTAKKPLPYDQQIKIFAEKIKAADHVIVGGASGLSAAGGGDFYYAATPSFKTAFKRYYDKYQISGAFAGMQRQWSSRGEFWGYLATFLHTTLHAPVRKPYADLQALLRDKDYFILTTNQDTQAIKAFPEEKVAQIQGDHRFFQCSQQCTDDVWDATAQIDEMYDYLDEHDTTVLPESMIPRCPHCGAEAFPWVRGYGNFLEGSRYQEQYQKISADIETHLPDKHVLFLELGVGRLTPMFIQEPFWALTNNLPGAYDVMVNRDYQFLPEQIEDKGVAIKGDLSQVLDDVRAALGC
ncbi:NAD-dependent protein deacetylase [Limosilactobacillus sp.]|jgi:NAD-dependent SIR2 family protein deacetylase|uniref:NAD-dependent protein deacetylase n=1 Tax=Limosilactobacillus sp. TaxID=2773925 RepID=UPI0025B7AA8D|nr:NAD-dependent protein deacetylase [Limosilactobacillus sp.]MCH3921576.1 NAD-dependent protein deacetylase [Limosilactobacillus sp.]MCH3928347.1 NAD-dependent protein deacetylase [Limosilactobacillus sp.]